MSSVQCSQCQRWFSNHRNLMYHMASCPAKYSSNDDSLELLGHNPLKSSYDRHTSTKWLNASYIAGNPTWDKISSETWQGNRMKGEVPSILGNERPIWPHNSSSMCRSRTGMGHHRIPCGGCIGADISHPPSTTIILESISARENFTWFGGTTISRRLRSCFRCFFPMKYSWTMSIGRCSSTLYLTGPYVPRY